MTGRPRAITRPIQRAGPRELTLSEDADVVILGRRTSGPAVVAFGLSVTPGAEHPGREELAEAVLNAGRLNDMPVSVRSSPHFSLRSPHSPDVDRIEVPLTYS